MEFLWGDGGYLGGGNCGSLRGIGLSGCNDGVPGGGASSGAGGDLSEWGCPGWDVGVPGGMGGI